MGLHSHTKYPNGVVEGNVMTYISVMKTWSLLVILTTSFVGWFWIQFSTGGLWYIHLFPLEWLPPASKSSRPWEQLWDGSWLWAAHSLRILLRWKLLILSHRGVPVGAQVTPFWHCWVDKARFAQDVRLLHAESTAHRPPMSVAIWNRPAHNARGAFDIQRRQCTPNPPC